MRVDEAAVDGFLAHVGDLLVIGDQLEHLQRRLALGEDPVALGRDMRQATAAFALLSNELQRSIMSIRRVPVRSLLQKAPRLAREVAAKAGKQVEVVVSGEDVTIDKSRVELLDGPLTHLVRNCVDHGIEGPERRRSAGKAPAGSVRIAASTGDGWFQLEIADDGRGLDLDAIRRKGEAMGLVRPGAVIDERGIVDLIFASGLSTAAQVSDVSGRGVGMDVVKRNIEDAGGSISVHSEPGKGCAFRIRIPSAVTTQIIAAYVVEEDAALYALPLDWIRESFADPGEPGPARVILRHGAGMPVGDLASALGTRRASPWPERRTVVVVRDGDGSRGWAVDRTMGVRQVVIRPLHRAVRGDAGGCFEGAALLGDGRLALVIDPRKLLARGS
jgi:two-component system chemotaxis sensor kinase CheA